MSGDIILGRDERVAQALHKMIPGTLGGRSKVAQPVVPTYVPRGLAMSEPAATPGELVGWYDASNASSITTSGDFLTNWADLSTYGLDLTPAVANFDTWGTETQNGLNVVSFPTPSQSRLSRPAFIWHQPLVIFIVAMCDSIATFPVDGGLLWNGGSAIAIGGGPGARVLSCNPGGGGTVESAPGSVELNVPFLVTIIATGQYVGSGPGTATMRINGVVADTAAMSTGSFHSNGAVGGVLDGSQPWRGWIGEIMVYGYPPTDTTSTAPALTDAQVEQHEGYLMGKWDL
jgi:hypothetical protein